MSPGAEVWSHSRMLAGSAYLDWTEVGGGGNWSAAVEEGCALRKRGVVVR